jgi:anti-sigma regulatory factor (Ser/Thr protein kinase)
VSHLTTDLRPTFEAPSVARAALADALAPPGAVEPQLAALDETARLLITELVSNSVRHASAAAGSQVRLDIDVEPDRLRIEVHDEGRGALEPVQLDRADEGFGLKIVDSLADRWGIDHDDLGTRAWFELSVAAP